MLRTVLTRQERLEVVMAAHASVSTTVRWRGDALGRYQLRCWDWTADVYSAGLCRVGTPPSGGADHVALLPGVPISKGVVNCLLRACDGAVANGLLGIIGGFVGCLNADGFQGGAGRAQALAVWGIPDGIFDLVTVVWIVLIAGVIARLAVRWLARRQSATTAFYGMARRRRLDAKGEMS